MDKELTKTGYRGCGIEWAPALSNEIAAALPTLPSLEIIAENFMYRNGDVLEWIADSPVPVLVHAVELSLGSCDWDRDEHVDRILAIADRVPAVNVSDHLGFCAVDGIDSVQPAILPWNQDTADVVSRNIAKIQAKTDLPFLLENEANRYIFPDNDWSEPALLNDIVRKTGCGLLLDLTNIYTNQINFGVDAFAWLAELDVAAVNTVHIAGGSYDPDGFLLDSHDAAVPEPVWELLRALVRRQVPEHIILERNGNFPSLAVLRREMAKADAIVAEMTGQAIEPAMPIAPGGMQPISERGLPL